MAIVNVNRGEGRIQFDGYIGMRYDIVSQIIPTIPLSAIACMHLRCHKKIAFAEKQTSSKSPTELNQSCVPALRGVEALP
jgi:hypothetical protein